MTVNAQNFIDECALAIEDSAKVTYSQSSWENALNDALQALIAVRPDANVVTKTWVISTGNTKQNMESGDLRLMHLTRNMGSDGNTPGSAIRGPVPREDLDAYDPKWHTKTGREVIEYIYDPNVPDVFYVIPAIKAGTTLYVEGDVVQVPSVSTPASENVPVNDRYKPALREWMFYYQYTRDDERSPNWVRGGRHFGNFFRILGIKKQADMAVDPKVIEYAT